MADVESKPTSEVDYDAVLAFLRKKGYSGTEEILRKEIGGANLNNSAASNREPGNFFNTGNRNNYSQIIILNALQDQL